MRRPRSLLVPALASLVVLAVPVAAPVALAKDGEARLDAPIPLDAEPGSTITVGWAALVSDQSTDHPMYGSPLFIRLVSPNGTAAEQGGKEDPPGSGHYVATLVVPPGGIARFEIGLRGEACTAGVCERSDWMLRISERPSGYGAPVAATTEAASTPAVGDAVAASPQPAVAPAATPAATDASVPMAFVLLALGLAAAVVGSIVASRRQRMRSADPSGR